MKTETYKNQKVLRYYKVNFLLISKEWNRAFWTVFLFAYIYASI
jgi:hypothetical protein